MSKEEDTNTIITEEFLHDVWRALAANPERYILPDNVFGPAPERSAGQPPVGSDMAIDQIAAAILNFGRADWLELRRLDLGLWHETLHQRGYLDWQPHHLEVIEAMRTLGWVCVSGPDRSSTPADLDNPDVPKMWAEDFFRRYVAQVRWREMKQRREIAARRRRDADVMGLSAEESDRVQERRDELTKELAELQWSTVFDCNAPRDFEPEDADLKEGWWRYCEMVARRGRYHEARPDLWRPLEPHDREEYVRKFAFYAHRDRRIKELDQELESLGVYGGRLDPWYFDPTYIDI